jgi:hypothetical protein
MRIPILYKNKATLLLDKGSERMREG